MTERPARAEVALAAATVAVLAWSFGPIIVRTVGVSTPTVVFWRMWLAQPVMIGAAYLAGGRLSLPLLRRAFLPGVLFGLSIITGFASYKTTSVANATLIANWPLRRPLPTPATPRTLWLRSRTCPRS